MFANPLKINTIVCRLTLFSRSKEFRMNIEGAPFVYLSPVFRNPTDAAAGVFKFDVVAVHVLYVIEVVFVVVIEIVFIIFLDVAIFEAID